MEDKIVEIRNRFQKETGMIAHLSPWAYYKWIENTQLYSAGEEVSDDDITIALENFTTEKGYSNADGTYIGDADLFEDGFMTAIKWMRSKLTRPTVSEEERTEAEKHEILQGFCEKISKQQDISPEFAAIVQRHFWDLI